MKIKLFELFTQKVFIPWIVYIRDLAMDKHWIGAALLVMLPLSAVAGIISGIKSLFKR